MLIREFHQHHARPDAAPSQGATEALKGYAQRVGETLGRIDLEVLTPLGEQSDHPPVRLREVFVAPQVRADPPPIELPRELMKRLIEDGELVSHETSPQTIDAESLERARKAYRQQPATDVLEILGDSRSQRVVVLGDPGSGKSTLARYLTLSLTSSTPDEALSPLAGWLPVIVELRRYAEDRWRERTFEDFLEYLYITEGMCTPRAILEEQLREGQCLVIFDGLDELFDPAVRAETSRRITAFSARYPGARIVVTSRVIGYQRTVFDAAHFNHYMLQELTRYQVAKFAELWYANACPDNRDLGARLKQRLSDAIDHSRPVRELAGNPLLLTILAIIGRRQTLPRDRLGVYRHAVTVLVARWDQDAKHLKASDSPEAIDILGAEERHELLRLLARRMQDGDGGIAGNHIHSRELAELFRDYLLQFEIPIIQATVAARFMVNQLRERNFILSRYGGEVYGFVHRAFLEYLAADDIAYRYKENREWDPDQLITEVFERRASDPAWHEVLLLLVGMLAEQDSSRAIECILSLHKRRQHGDDFRILALAVQALAEVRKIGPLARQSKAVIDELIAATSKASYAPTLQLTSALPALATFSEFWIGREHFLHWFHARGQFLETRIVGVSPGDVAHALCQDPAMLRRFAIFGSGGQHRSSALRSLAARWSGMPETLAILRDRAVEDPDYQPRAVALEQLATYCADHPDTLELLHDRATQDPDEDVRSSALRMLAAHWTNRSETLELLHETAIEDPAGTCRAVALEQVATYWSDHPDTLELLHDRATQDPNEVVRSSALRMLAAHWTNRPETLELLHETAIEDPADTCRAVALEQVATYWADHHDTGSLLHSRAVEDMGWHPRAVALEQLAAHHPTRAETITLLYSRAVDEPDPYPRGTALELWAAQSADKSSVLQFLRTRAIEDTHEHCRGSALRILAAKWSRDPQVLQFVRSRALEDPDDHCRSSALRMLAAHWRDLPETHHFLSEQAVKNDSSGPRSAAIGLLVTHWRDEPNTFALACDRATKDDDEKNRQFAFGLLAAYWPDRPQTIAISQSVLTNDSDPKRRLTALQIVVAGGGATDAQAAMSYALNDVSSLVRKEAIWVLVFSRGDNPDTRNILRKLVDFDGDENVRAEARRALDANAESKAL